MIKKLLYCALGIAIFNWVEHWTHKKTDGFSVRRIQFERETLKLSLPPQPSATWSNPGSNQVFHYLDCGNQCYVFVSADGQTVLKFFKYAHPSIPHFLTRIPGLNLFKPFRPHRFEKLLWKRNRDMQGYRLAYDRFREETALLALHLDPYLNSADGHYPTVTIIDKIGCTHTIDLNMTPFIVQKKASATVYEQLKEWIAQGDVDQAKVGIKSLVNLLKQRIQANIQDDDVHFYSNFGFIGSQAVQLDPGHFKQGIFANPNHELKIITYDLFQWCQKHAPSLIEVLQEEKLYDE